MNMSMFENESMTFMFCLVLLCTILVVCWLYSFHYIVENNTSKAKTVILFVLAVTVPLFGPMYVWVSIFKEKFFKPYLNYQEYELIEDLTHYS